MDANYIAQLATLFSMLADEAYTMRTVESLVRKTGLVMGEITCALEDSGINFEVKRRRSDGAELIEIVRG